MFCPRYQSPRENPIDEQQQQSGWEYPDVTKSKFFRLKDLQILNDSYYQELENIRMDQPQITDQSMIQESSRVLGDLSISNISQPKQSSFIFKCFDIYNRDQNIGKGQQTLFYKKIDENINEQSKMSEKLNAQMSDNLGQSNILNLSNSRPMNQTKKQQESMTKKPLIQSFKQYQQKLEFKLQLKQPQLCMGAFSHTQFFNLNSINVSIPSIQQQPPFAGFFGSSLSQVYDSRYVPDPSIDESLGRIKQTQMKFFRRSVKDENILKDIQDEDKDREMREKQKEKQKFEQNLYALAVIEPSFVKEKNQQEENVYRALQEGLIQIEEGEISFIEHKPNSYQQQEILSRSIFQNYSLLLQTPQYSKKPTWQSRVVSYNPNQPNISLVYPSKPFVLSCFQVSYEWHSQQLSLLQSQFSIEKDAQFLINDKKLFNLITQMLQGIENNLFLLDYERLEWYVDMRGFKFEHGLRNSIIEWVKEYVELANMRIRLDRAVEYIRTKQARKVYMEVGKVVEEVLKVFEEYLLEYIENSNFRVNDQQCRNQQSLIKVQKMQQQEKFGLVQYFCFLSELSPEIKLLYSLLIPQTQINQQQLLFIHFDHRFLNSQFHIFESILKLSRQIDQSPYRTSILIKKLLRASFQPIVSSLERILFEEMTSISSKDQIYLKYYYESTKELFTQVSKKMELVARESPELYLLCKQRLQMRIQSGIDELRVYEQEWSKLFYFKFHSIQIFLTQMIKKQHEARHIIQKQKQSQLLALKQKLKEKTEKEKSSKLAQKQKRDSQLMKLRLQIKEKQERRKLEDLIEKEKERGYLLQEQLKRKIELLKEKDRLIKIRDRQNGQNLQNQNNTDIEPRLDQQKVEIIRPQSQQQLMLEQISQPSSIKMPQIKAKKWNSHQQQQNQEKQCLPNNQMSQIILPIVNQQQNIISENNLEPEKLPLSPKSQKSRKIRKNTGKIKQVKVRRQGLGKIYFNKKLLPKDDKSFLNMPEQNINFVQLCQKSKKLSFQLRDEQITQKNQEQYMQQDSYDSTQSIQIDDTENQQQRISPQHQHYIPTNCIFQICIDKILHNQSIVINNCFQILVFQKYHFRDIIKFMKSIFMSENGQHHHNLLSLSANTNTSQMSLKSFSECFLFDNLPQHLRLLHPTFYATRQESLQQIQQRLIHYNSQIASFNLIQSNLQEYVGFQFSALPHILQPYFSYIHMSKYMQIFSFILRIKHCEMIVGETWVLLNDYKKKLWKLQKANSQRHYYDQQDRNALKMQNQLVQGLFVTRHVIQSFLTTYQNYIFFRVIQKEYKFLNRKIQSHELHDLQNHHLKLLDSIIRFAFVDNPTNNITKEIRKLMEFIREFRNIVNMICLDDVLYEQKAQIRKKIQFIHTSFRQNQKFFQALYFKT